MPVSLIAAVSANGVIGRDGKLPWHLSADLKRFKRLTTGHHLIVGRATWESVGRPLPDRTFLVVSSRPGLEQPGVVWMRSIDEALALAVERGDDEPFIAGGEGIYREALDRGVVDRIYLTRILREYEGDALFPPFDESEWRAVSREAHAADPVADLPAFEFVVYERERALTDSSARESQ